MKKKLDHFSEIKILCLFIIGIWICDCKSKEPVNISPGDRSCVHCQMTIVDMRFHVQAISSTGKNFPFDSVECMVLWKQNNPDLKADIWLKNYLFPDQWLSFQEAVIVTSPEIHSPMGAGLAALDRIRLTKEKGRFTLVEKSQLLDIIQRKVNH